jgi:hypothetical protein
MVVSLTPTIYEQVVEVTYEYLGPAAERFVSRQIETHLKKKPQSLSRRDLKQLTDWIKLAANLLSDDRRLVNAYLNDLNLIVTNKP